MTRVPWALVASWGAAILGGIGVAYYKTLMPEDQARLDQLVERHARDLYGRAASQLTPEQVQHIEVIARRDFAV